MGKAKRSGFFGGLVLSLVCAGVAGQGVQAPEAVPAARSTPNSSFGTMVKTGVQPAASNFGVLLGGTTELQHQLEIEAAKSVRAAQVFGASLSAADRRELQGACAALVANPNDAAASTRLRQTMSRYQDNSAEAITRFCLDPVLKTLQAELQASRQTLERMSAAGGDAQANVDLQNTLQRQQQTLKMISNVMKTKHDTAKNSISNAR